jgi:hypothetical protein
LDDTALKDRFQQSLQLARELLTDFREVEHNFRTLDRRVREHPRPAVYLRQIDLPGVHTKFIEGHRGVLAALLDLVQPAEAIDAAGTGVGGFCRRYGFLNKPSRVRFWVLDPNIRLLPTAFDQDITLTQASFGQLALPVSKVFITENEINFLAFPNAPDAMVIFGAGYGFDNLAAAPWLKQKEIGYWGGYRYPRLCHPQSAARGLRPSHILSHESAEPPGSSAVLGR